MNALTIDILKNDFIKSICDSYGIGINELNGNSRAMPLPKLRGFVFYRLIKSGYTTTKAGKTLNRDHSTVIYWTKRINNNPGLLHEYLKL